MPSPPSVKAPPEFVSRQVTAARRFYLNLNPRPSEPMTVVCGGWEHCSADYEIVREGFPFLSVEFVAAGKGQLQLAGRTHSLEPGTVFTYGPGVMHQIRTSAEDRLVKYFVDFSGRGALNLMRKLHLHPGTLLRLHSAEEVRAAFDLLIHRAGRHDRHTGRVASLQLELLLLSIDDSAQTGRHSARRSIAVFERCRAYLEANYLELRTIGPVAAACHVDISYLSRLFRRFAEDSPFRYLQRLQMQWAAQRLDESGLRVSDVAGELGIDPFQFSRTFKRIHGVSPAAFLGLRSEAKAKPAAG